MVVIEDTIKKGEQIRKKKHAIAKPKNSEKGNRRNVRNRRQALQEGWVGGPSGGGDPSV